MLREVSREHYKAFLDSFPSREGKDCSTINRSVMQWVDSQGRVQAQAIYVSGGIRRYEVNVVHFSDIPPGGYCRRSKYRYFVAEHMPNGWTKVVNQYGESLHVLSSDEVWPMDKSAY